MVQSKHVSVAIGGKNGTAKACVAIGGKNGTAKSCVAILKGRTEHDFNSV